jgi:hypothetical protein
MVVMTLTETERRVLCALIRTGNHDSARLCEETSLSFAPLNSAVSRLRHKGYVDLVHGHLRILLCPDGRPWKIKRLDVERMIADYQGSIGITTCSSGTAINVFCSTKIAVAL